MEKRLKALKLLASCPDSDWKIGKSDTYIRNISSKISTLPDSVFSGFYIDKASSKKISTVDFALMTYDMDDEAQIALMDIYGINLDTISEILQVADQIAEVMDSEPEIQATSFYPAKEPDTEIDF